MSRLISRMMAAIQAATAAKTSAYDTVATVKRVEGNTAWVHIPGGVDETPAKMTVNARPGDTVQVRVGGGKAFLVGNATAPPTDDGAAIVAKEAADAAALAALKARQRAYEAQRAAYQNAVDMANAVVAINQDIDDLQSQIDGNITSWFYTTDPSMSAPPVTVDPDNPDSTGWDTDAKKANHVGDLYYNTNSGYVWRFVYQSGSYQWVRVQDSDVTRALEMAADAQDTADSKRRVFITTPTPPYDEGDLWFAGSAGDILTCTTAKVDGQLYEATDWSKLNKYTNDDRANAAYNLAEAANGTAGTALASANGKNKVYHKASQPSGGTYIVGDTWFDTDNGYKMYTYDGSTWVAEQFGNAAIADLSITNAKIADGTIQTAQIETVAAGKLTTGSRDADWSEAGSLEMGKISGLQSALDAKVATGANISVLTNDGTYATGRMRSITLSSAKSYTYSDAARFVGLSSDSWSGVSSIGGGAWNKGDMVAIPCTITDRNNAAAFFLCRIVSYSGTTLVADNLALELDSDASKYITEISGYDGVSVHDAGDTSNFANMNSNGFFIYNGGSLNGSFEANQTKMGGGKAILKYSEDGSAFGIQDSHRVVVAKATDESGVRNDATLSSREISTFTYSKPMAFINATHKVSGSTKSAQAGLYAWRGSSIVPTYVILQEGNGSGSDPLGGDAVRGLYISVPKLMINGNDWTNLLGDYDTTAAAVGDLNIAVSDIAMDVANLEPLKTKEPNASTKFVRNTHSFTIASISANSTSGEKTVTFTKSGYYPVGVVGWKSAAGKVMFPRLEITSASSGSVTVTYNAFNANTQVSGSLSATVDILWVKTS